jgi:flagellar export protein FliJ
MDEGGGAMKKFQFHLEKLLSYKDQMLDSEMMNLAVLNGLLASAQEKLSALENERDRYNDELSGKVKGHVSPATFRLYASYESHIKEEMKLCQREIAEISAQIEKQIEIIKELKKETRSLETLKEAKYTEYKKEDIKRSELFMDEFISRSRIIEKAN